MHTLDYVYLRYTVPFPRIHLAPRFRIGSKAHLAKTGAAPIETPILTGSNAYSSANSTMKRYTQLPTLTTT